MLTLLSIFLRGDRTKNEIKNAKRETRTTQLQELFAL